METIKITNDSLSNLDNKIIKSNQYIISSELQTIVQTLKDNICCGISNSNILETIQRVNFDKHEQMFNFLVNQKSVNKIDPNYSMYKINFYTNEVSHHCDISGDIKNNFYTNIQADDKFLILNCLSIESLLVFLTENTFVGDQNKINQHIFIPVVFSSEVNTVGHYAVLIFDIIKKTVYFADPNGSTSFFNNILYVIAKQQSELITHNVDNIGNANKINYCDAFNDMYIDTELLLEKMFEFHINEFNKLTGSTYEFIKRKQWNPFGYTVNKSYNDTLIGSGHCVVLGVMVANYCHIKKCNPIEIYELLSKLSKLEIIELINSYSLGIYNILIYV